MRRSMMVQLYSKTHPECFTLNLVMILDSPLHYRPVPKRTWECLRLEPLKTPKYFCTSFGLLGKAARFPSHGFGSLRCLAPSLAPGGDVRQSAARGGTFAESENRIKKAQETKGKPLGPWAGRPFASETRLPTPVGFRNFLEAWRLT